MYPLHVPPTEKFAVPCRIRRFALFREPTSLKRVAVGVIVFLVGGLGIPVEAGLAYWGSEGFVENADSHHRPWTSDFSMELGVFSKGFVPTFDNREQWSSKWNKLDRAVFDPSERRFAGMVDLSLSLPVGSDSSWA